MKMKVSAVDREADKLDLLVVFELKDGVVEADWKSGSGNFQSEIEEDGIATSKGLFFPLSGKPFLENLKIAFSNSSNIVVESL